MSEKKKRVKVNTPKRLQRADRISNRLKELRERGCSLTQEEVSAIIGIAVTTVSRHESGTRSMDADDIRRYAKLFKIESAEIFVDIQGQANNGDN